ncbi:hypothetical protein EZS27_029183 [termite gut metagenome]|uniref:Uncharacterized protein n=1 Tax=termite gut metagenome TaxID=433724 RepID=A0A5J4QJD0_9ZZZZ
MCKKSLNIVVACSLWIFFLLFSCVDQSYDLNKDIDLTLTVGGDSLIFPLGNTEKMYLSKFVKVEDSDLLYEVKEEGEHKGEYKLSKEAKISNTEVIIDDVAIEVEDTKLDDVDDIPPIPSGTGPSAPIDDLPAFTFTTGGDLVLENNNMPEEIISIYSLIPGLTKSKLPRLSLDFEVREKNNKSLDAVKEILLDNFTLTLPKCLVLDGDQVISKEDFLDPDKNINYTTYTIGSASFSPTDPNVFSLDLTLISFEDEEGGLAIGPLEPGIGFKREYKVSLTSRITVQLSSVSAEELELVLTPVISISEIPIASVSGQINPALDIESTTVELEGLPDFLQDDDVKLDLENPQIFLNVSNPLGIPILINATMRGLKNGVQTHKEKIITGNIEIPANQDITIILSKLGGTDDAVNNIQYKEINNLNDMFLIIPEQIELDINAQADQGKRHMIDLGKTYPIEMNYKIDMPLSFGPELTIIYNETIDGWNKDIKDLKDLDMENIYLAANVENTIPLEFHMSGYAVDVNGNKLDGITVGVANNQPIAPGKAETAGLSSLIIEIVTQNPNSGIMKKIDGVVLRFKANSNSTVNGIPLKSSQYILMKNMKATLPEGASVNLN